MWTSRVHSVKAAKRFARATSPGLHQAVRRMNGFWRPASRSGGSRALQGFGPSEGGGRGVSGGMLHPRNASPCEDHGALRHRAPPMTATSAPDFIHVIEDALDPAWCAAVVERFAGSREAQPGRVGSGVFPDMKDSLDLTISTREDWQDVANTLNQAVIAGLARYVRRWPHAVVAPLMLETQDGGKRQRLTADRLQAMDDDALMPLLMHVFRPGAINLQRYTAGRGGYPYWHCELMPRDASAETLHRHLLWTVYLNDGFAEGETEFLYQQRKVAPKTGALLIAPAAFTHTHRGNRPQGGDKVIATSWILFQRAETLFGAR